MGTVDDLVATADGGFTLDIDVVGPGDASQVLAGVAGVQDVDAHPGGFHVRADRDVRIEVVDACRDAGFGIRRLVSGTTDLDAVYHSYFGGSHDDRV